VKHGYPENGWAWLAISAGAGHDNTTRTAAGPKQFPLAGMSWNSFCGPLSWELLSFLMVTDALDTWNLARSAQWLHQRAPVIGPAGSKGQLSSQAFLLHQRMRTRQWQTHPAQTVIEAIGSGCQRFRLSWSPAGCVRQPLLYRL